MSAGARRVRIPAVAEEGPRPWRVWARSLVGLSATQAAVVRVLADLADWRGEMIVSVDWLVRESMRPERSVKRALAELEDDGVLVRRRRRCGGHQAASLVSLVPAPVVRPGLEPVMVFEVPDFAPEGEAVGVDDDEGLRELIGCAADAGWVGREVETLGRSLWVAAPKQLATAIRRGRELSRMSPDEALADTVGWAWQALREDRSGQIVGARSPWAVWTTATTRLVLHQRDCLIPEDAWDPGKLPAGCDLPGEIGDVVVGLSDLEGEMRVAVEALIAAGMEETVAWAGTQRVAQLALRGASRAHTAAAQDPRLGDLGASPECARAWMTLLVGSRKGAKASVLTASAQQMREQACLVVEAHRDTVR